MRSLMVAIIIILTSNIAIAETEGETEAAKTAKLAPHTVVDTQSGQVIAIFDKGIAIKQPRLNCNIFTDCFDFCVEVCNTGQLDVCFCGGQSFPCLDITEPPVCEVIKK